ncbi:MAG TPA: pyruvate kinase [Thermoanaerobaculia bacterium]
MPRAKIVCTIGPASESPAILESLVRSGMDVARLNFSHGTLDEHAANIRTIREISRRAGRPVAILQDLAGIKLRLGEIAAGNVRLEPGARFTLTNRPVPGDANEASIAYPDLPKSVRPGDKLLLADGDIELEAMETSERDIACRVISGGVISSHKGINLPTRSIEAPSLTEKDRKDLAFGIEQGVDFVALSFVRNAGNVSDARRFIESGGASIPLIAKIEKHEALANIDAILGASDGIMVARGDLGVETPLQHVPLLQKMLIAKANRAGKPVITATQMLRSMIDCPRPTRAEAADVANAILDGTDAVMMSEETASGRYPVESLEMMVRIAEDAETAFPYDVWRERIADIGVQSLPEAVADAACTLADDMGAAAIIACTQSGAAARLVARHRPRQPILALTPLPETCLGLSLVWGVSPIRIDPPRSTDELMDRVPGIAVESGHVRPGDRIVITAGIPVGVSGSTNTIKAAVVG